MVDYCNILYEWFSKLLTKLPQITTKSSTLIYLCRPKIIINTMSESVQSGKDEIESSEMNDTETNVVETKDEFEPQSDHEVQVVKVFFVLFIFMYVDLDLLFYK